MLGSIHETIHQVIRDMLFVTFALINVVVEVPEGPAVPVKVFIESINGYALLISMINKEGLKAKQIKRSRRQTLNII